MSELVVLAGQSNAGVYNLTPADVGAAGYTPDAHVQIWTASGFQTLQPGVNTGLPNYPTSWGPEVSLARDWLETHVGETLYIVKSVKGSTSLEAGVAPNWSPEQPALPDGTPNGMFNKTTLLVDAAKAATGLGVADVFWMQGETDAADPTAAGAYQAHLVDLLAHMRSDWGATDVVIGRIGDEAGLAYADQVRAAQLAVAIADPHAALVDTDSFGLQPDHLHLSAAGALGLGDAFFAAAELQQLAAHVGHSLFMDLF